jgi:hypothetical protein
MLPHVEPWVGFNLNGGGVSAEVHHPSLPSSAPEQEGMSAMSRRGNFTLTRYVGKRGIHKQYSYRDVGWRSHYNTGDGVITAVQEDE